MQNYTKNQISEALQKAVIPAPAEITFRNIYKLLKDKNADESNYTVSIAKLIRFLLLLGFDYKEFAECDREGVFDYFKRNVSIENENNEKNLWDKVVDTIPIKKGKVVGENLVHSGMPLSLEQATAFFQKLKSLDKIEVIGRSDSNGLFDISSENKVFFTRNNGMYAGVDITKSDDIWLQFNIPVNTHFFIITEIESGYPSKPVALGTFLYLNQSYYLEVESQNISIDFSRANRAYMLLFANEAMTRFYAVEFEMISEELPVDREHYLCIDFGTSNTTAGTWLRAADGKDHMELVTFDDVTEAHKKETNLLPTAVYIQSATIGPDRKPVDVKMLFGYEAKKHLIDCDYDVKGSMFLNIKQWIAADDNLEVECKDEYDQVFMLPVYEIIARYIKKVIQLAEIKLKRQFVKFHFSAPVKLKTKFNTIVNQILPAPTYTVVPVSKSLDEGIAIIYERISQLRAEFEKNPNPQNASGDVMIIDCGGGTTDVASCRYQFEQSDTGTRAKITTRFENGQNNFGGNDITYRIFQLLKVKLRDYYVKGSQNDSINVTIDELMNSETDDYLEYVDYCIQNKQRFGYYDKLDAVSKEAEWVIPTDYGNREIVDGSNMMRWANRNFNYLWQLAERLKIEFFSNDKMASFYAQTDKTIKADPSMYFWVDTTGAKQNRKLKLDKRTDIPDIEINIKELVALLSPQIYYILSIMMTPPTESGQNTDLPHQKIHLSGQSCKINLFRDLLKEFVPGKRTRRGKLKSENAAQMKLACVKGCILYMMEQEFGAVTADISMDSPKILYSVVVDRGVAGSTTTLLDGPYIKMKDGKKTIYKLPICRRTYGEGSIRFTVYNRAFGNPVEEYTDSVKVGMISTMDKGITDLNELMMMIKNTGLSGLDEYICRSEGREEGVLDRLMRDLQNEPADATGKLLIFAVPNNDGCGFVLWQIVKQEMNGNRVFHVVGETPLYYEKVERIQSRYYGQNCSNEGGSPSAEQL